MGLGTSAAASAQAVGKAPSCHCRAAILIDKRTGQVLWEYHAYRQMDPASTTKIMTAYLVIRHGHLNRVVSVSKQAAATPGSRMRLYAGQHYTIMDLLRGLLLRSGNDAAVALAQADRGSVPAFVADMNQTARRLGAYNTHFVNPNGLTARGHYSSAYDLALITRAALRLPLFQHLVSTDHDYVQEATRSGPRSFSNTNRLLQEFPPADGVKTGTTNAAGRCLVASATQHGFQVIVVLLDAQDRWTSARQLLQWAFRTYQAEPPVVPGAPLAVTKVRGGVPNRVSLVPALHLAPVLVPKGLHSRVLVTHVRQVMAPVRHGELLGTAYIVGSGQVLAIVPLGAQSSVPKASPPSRWWEQFLQWLWH